jgi:predicted nuclease of restriction endonuclease-like (RecB) superfamily
MTNNKQLEKREKPSVFIEKKLTKIERDVITYLCDNLEISEEEAENLLHSNQAHWDRIISAKKKQYTLEMFSLMTQFKDATEQKIKIGSLEQAKAGMTGIAIGSDKVFVENTKPTFSIGGKNVQINLGFKYQPLKKEIADKK